jgi:hypothetical protein
MHVQPTDLELAALISSKICHDVINPVGAIVNGLEMLDEDDDAESKAYALNMISPAGVCALCVRSRGIGRLANRCWHGGADLSRVSRGWQT